MKVPITSWNANENKVKFNSNKCKHKVCQCKQCQLGNRVSIYRVPLLGNIQSALCSDKTSSNPVFNVSFYLFSVFQTAGTIFPHMNVKNESQQLDQESSIRPAVKVINRNKKGQPQLSGFLRACHSAFLGSNPKLIVYGFMQSNLLL